MFILDQLGPGIRLLNWNAELPSSGTGDPLGLTLRVGARIAAELSHCITSITPRARYYSFFPWAFERARTELGDEATLNDLVLRVILHERAMLLGAVLHHEGQTCEGGNLQGSSPASLIAQDPNRDPIHLDAWQHLQANEGGFAAYKGSLINLGLFLNPDEDSRASVDKEFEAEETDDAEVTGLTSGHLSEKGQRLAQSFGKSVAESPYLEHHPNTAIDFETLKEFGGRAGLCELRSADNFDLIPLRDLFFAKDIQSAENSDFRRRMTLLLVMQAAHLAKANGAELTSETFNDLTFYRRFFTVGEQHVEVNLPAELEDASERWRIFHFHSYITTALEALLAGTVRTLRGHPNGLSVSEITETFGTPEAQKELIECLQFSPSRPFLEMTVAEAMALVGLDVAAIEKGDMSEIGRYKAGPPLERSLRSLLVDRGLVSGSAGPALATILLYSILLRFEFTVSERHQGWNRQKVFDSYNDVSVPGVLDMLKSHFGVSWWEHTSRELLERVLARFVVRQHEAMSYARGFGGSPALFHLSGERVIGTDQSRDNVDPGNARFWSLVQILWDLRLLGGESGQELTDDGRKLLAFYVEGAIL